MRFGLNVSNLLLDKITDVEYYQTELTMDKVQQNTAHVNVKSIASFSALLQRVTLGIKRTAPGSCSTSRLGRFIFLSRDTDVLEYG